MSTTLRHASEILPTNDYFTSRVGNLQLSKHANPYIANMATFSVRTTVSLRGESLALPMVHSTWGYEGVDESKLGMGFITDKPQRSWAYYNAYPEGMKQFERERSAWMRALRTKRSGYITMVQEQQDVPLHHDGIVAEAVWTTYPTGQRVFAFEPMRNESIETGDSIVPVRVSRAAGLVLLAALSEGLSGSQQWHNLYTYTGAGAPDIAPIHYLQNQQAVMQASAVQTIEQLAA
jgi:hypothetical protein